MAMTIFSALVQPWRFYAPRRLAASVDGWVLPRRTARLAALALLETAESRSIRAPSSLFGEVSCLTAGREAAPAHDRADTRKE
jgi:hypothetical protein